MKKIKSTFLVITLIFSSFGYLSCEDGINLFTESDDVDLGAEVAAEIEANPAEYPIFRGDPSIKQYINQRIFSHILESPEVNAKDIFPYQLEIIDKPDELNAFALPGGYIYVYSGLLKYLDSEAALAGVLGHEIAHSAKRHSTQRMTAYYGVSFLISLLLGENPSEIAEIAANLFVGLAFLANSRADEDESDEYSFKYLQDTRYYPGGVKFFFEKMRDDGLVSSQSNEIATFLSTHPDPIERIANTDSLLRKSGIEIKDYRASGNGYYKDEYQAYIRSKMN